MDSSLQEEEKHRDVPVQHDHLAAGHHHHAAGSHRHVHHPGLLRGGGGRHGPRDLWPQPCSLHPRHERRLENEL